MGTTAAARRHRADPHVVRAAAPHCSALQLQDYGRASGAVRHSTIRDVHCYLEWQA